MTGWLPIETAPKDGSDIILCKIAPIAENSDFGISAKAPFVWWAVKGSWSSRWKKWWDGIEPSGLAGPTHWMPIPEPPK